MWWTWWNLTLNQNKFLASIMRLVSNGKMSKLLKNILIKIWKIVQCFHPEKFPKSLISLCKVTSDLYKISQSSIKTAISCGNLHVNFAQHEVCELGAWGRWLVYVMPLSIDLLSALVCHQMPPFSKLYTQLPLGLWVRIELKRRVLKEPYIVYLWIQEWSPQSVSMPQVQGSLFFGTYSERHDFTVS